jgi:hypothetical protein
MNCYVSKIHSNIYFPLNMNYYRPKILSGECDLIQSFITDFGSFLSHFAVDFEGLFTANVRAWICACSQRNVPFIRAVRETVKSCIKNDTSLEGSCFNTV